MSLLNFLWGSSGSAADWQSSEKLPLAFKSFHDKYAREPREEMSRAMTILHKYISEIETHFRRRGICHYLEYTGSSYEGVKVRKTRDNDDLEYDVMMVIDKHAYDLQAIEETENPGYARLKLKWDGEAASLGLDKVLKTWGLFGFFKGEQSIDAILTKNIFFGELQKLVNNSETMKGKVKLINHGPAVQMDVHPDSGVLFWGDRLFSVDIVPAYAVDSRLFVAKPIKGQELDSMIWRQSFSIQEKQKLVGGAKNVLRVLKVVRNREAGLTPLTSYHLKTALFHEMDEESDWGERAQVQRFLGVLWRLDRCLTEGNLPHYFLPRVNLLSSFSYSAITNIRDRIHRIRTSETQLMKIFAS